MAIPQKTDTKTQAWIIIGVAGIFIAASCFLRLFHSFYFLRQPGSFLVGIGGFLTVVLVSTLVACLTLWLIPAPLFSVLRRIRGGETVKLEERTIARKRLGHLSWLLIGANIASFTIMSLIGFLAASGGTLDILNVSLTIALDLVVGLMTGLQQTNVCDALLLKPCEELSLTQLNQGPRDAGLQSRLILATLGAVLLAATLSGLAAIGFYREISGWANSLTADALAAASVADNSAINANIGSVVWQMALLAGILCLWAFGLITTAVYGVHSQIRRLSQRMKEISSGSSHLGQRAHIVFFDEIGELTQDINQVLSNLQSLVRHVKTTAATVEDGARRLGDQTVLADSAVGDLNRTLQQVQASVTQQSETVGSTSSIISWLKQTIGEFDSHMQNQASLVDDSSSSITEIASNITAVSAMTTQADTLAGSLTGASDSGGKAVADMIGSMHEIESASHQVSGIVSVISKISAQTNLLAMNAAIEAAHAGDLGSGFAVVADEVRKLAETSARSAREIITHIRAMDAKIGVGVKLAEHTGKSFQSISQDILTTGRLIQTIAQSMQEQKVGADLILGSIAKLTESSSFIKQLASSQNENFGAMDHAMGEIVISTKAIEQAVAAQSQGAQTLVELISRVRAETETNSRQVAVLQSTVNGFEI